MEEERGQNMAKKGTSKKQVKKQGEKRGKNTKPKDALTKKEKALILTENQERFLFYIVYEGLSQREAYRKAYPNCHAKDSVVDVKASQLMALDKVRIRYKAMLDDSRRRRYKRAVARAPLMEDRLYKIGMGESKITITNKHGQAVEVYPSVKEQTKALADLSKIYSEIMNNEEFKPVDSGEKQIIINITPFEEK